MLLRCLRTVEQLYGSYPQMLLLTAVTSNKFECQDAQFTELYDASFVTISFAGIPTAV